MISFTCACVAALGKGVDWMLATHMICGFLHVCWWFWLCGRKRLRIEGGWKFLNFISHNGTMLKYIQNKKETKHQHEYWLGWHGWWKIAWASFSMKEERKTSNDSKKTFSRCVYLCRKIINYFTDIYISSVFNVRRSVFVIEAYCLKSNMCGFCECKEKRIWILTKAENFISKWIFIHFRCTRDLSTLLLLFSSIYVLSIYHAYQHLHISSIFPASISTSSTWWNEIELFAQCIACVRSCALTILYIMKF